MTEAGFHRSALALALLVALVAVLRFEGPADGYWDTYITAPAMHLAGAEVDFLLRDGTPLLEYELTGRLPDDLVDRESFGIITKDQRLGAGVVAAPWFAAFGLAGLRLVHGLAWAIVALGGVLCGRVVLGPGAGALVAGALLSWNGYSVAVNRLNPNVFALAAGTVLVAVLLRAVTGDGQRRGIGFAALAGVLFGAIGNIRPEVIVAAPAVAAGLWWGGAVGRPRLLRFGVAFGAAALLILPTLLWSAHAFGDPLLHSSQYAEFEGFRPSFPHRIFGVEFAFNGLLNLPFHDALVRTPHFPLPTFLTVTLLPLITWGGGLLVAALLGLFAIAELPRGRQILAVLLGWSVPLFLLLLPHENWDELKMTYSLLWFPAAAVAAPAGVVAAGSRMAASARPLQSAALAALLLAIPLLAQQAVVRWVDVPVDERWYERFPGAAVNGSGIELMTDVERRGWAFFHTRESEEELSAERAKLGRPSLLPGRWWQAEPSWVEGGRALGRELGVRELHVLAVWYYIYGGERDDVGSAR